METIVDVNIDGNRSVQRIFFENLHSSQYQIIADTCIIIVIVTSFVGLDPSDLRIVAGHATFPCSDTALSLLQLGTFVKLAR
jgi:hypothetical protein